jgi:hypothetical protein
MVTDGLNPFTLLALLGAVLAGAGVTALYAFARITGRREVERAASIVGAAGAGAYLLLVAIASVTSHDRVLALGEEKHICEVDCHLAYSVAGAKAEPQLDGRVRYVVTVRVRFDEETISSYRPKDASLSPNRRYVALVDHEGRQYPGSPNGLKRRLIPGESYTTDLVFDVPAAAQSLRLVLRNDDFETRFIIGHENSLGHGKTTFALARIS